MPYVGESVTQKKKQRGKSCSLLVKVFHCLQITMFYRLPYRLGFVWARTTEKKKHCNCGILFIAFCRHVQLFVSWKNFCEESQSHKVYIISK